MSIIDFSKDIRVDDYYRSLENIPKWVIDNKTYGMFLYNVGDMKRIAELKYERRLARMKTDN